MMFKTQNYIVGGKVIEKGKKDLKVTTRLKIKDQRPKNRDLGIGTKEYGPKNRDQRIGTKE